MEEGRFIRLNTAFKPPEDVTRAIIDLSKEISKEHEAFFVLDGVNFHPHITIYSPEFPEHNLEKVLKNVEEIAQNTKKIRFVFRQKDNQEGFMGMGFEISPEINKVHEEIVARLNPLREGRIRDKYKLPEDDYKMAFSSEQRKNIEQYGYPDVMSLYFPHLTIIRLKDETAAEKINKDLKWVIPRFTVDKIAVYTMGENGTCTGIIKEFELK